MPMSPAPQTHDCRRRVEGVERADPAIHSDRTPVTAMIDDLAVEAIDDRGRATAR